jgi:Fur family iron response transcriptional regulator|tara:strand:- start:27 stop:443 length:417 start_codon:yes stop_codon:yes gene_type:complete
MTQKTSNYITKLRNSKLRPTKQRIKICEALFDRSETFHFTIRDLYNLLTNNLVQKISLATVYNTVHAFKNSGYLKQVNIDSNNNYFDTNTSHHHHFFDETNNELIDLNNEDIKKIELKKIIPGKKIKSVEVLVKIEPK